MSKQANLAHLFRALKAPAAARALPKLADRARAEQWSYEHFAAALLKTETDTRGACKPAEELVPLRPAAQRHSRLDTELDRLQRIPLLIVDEVGYIPFDP